MDDLISRSELLKSYDIAKMVEYDETGCGVDRIAIPVDTIKKAPAIDAEPVRHGRWVKDKERNTYCSVCDCYIPAVHCRQDYQDDFSEWDEEIDETDYCPHCGAKMDAKEA